MLESAIAKARGRLLPILMVCYFAAFLDRVNVGFAALQMNQDLGFSATVYGFGAGIFYVTYVLCEVPSNLLMTRFGARVWIARILLTWGLVSAATAFVWDRQSFFVLRTLLGAAEAGFFPGMLYYLTQWFPRTHRARMTATVQTAVPISTIVGAPLSGVILQFASGWMGLRGWQWMFLLEAVPAVVMGVVVLLSLPDSPNDAKWLTEGERAALLAELEDDRRRQEAVQRFTVRQALTDRRVLLMCLIGFGNVVGTTSIALWLPQVVRTIGGSPAQTGLLTAIPAVAGLVALLACAWNADRTGERVWHVAAPYLAAALGLTLAASADSAVLVVLGLTIGSAGITGASPSVWALPAILLTGTASAAALALINSFGSVGGFLGPLIVGRLYDDFGSFSVALLLIGGVLVVTAGVALVIGRLMRENLRTNRKGASARAVEGNVA